MMIITTTMIMVLASGLIYYIFYNALYLKRQLIQHINYYYYYYYYYLLLLYYYHYYYYLLYYCYYYYRYCRSRPRRYPLLRLALRPPSKRTNSGSYRTGLSTERLLLTTCLQLRVNSSRTSWRQQVLKIPLILRGLQRQSQVSSLQERISTQLTK